MAKFYGKVGYINQEEAKPGKVVFKAVERDCFGDILRFGSRWERSDYLNDDISLSNSISILADAFAYQNFASIKYVNYMGANWTVTSIEVQPPRLILTIGGPYHGQMGATTG